MPKAARLTRGISIRIAGPANFDIKHSWTTSGIYELPFGKGQRFAAGLTPLANKLVGGWQIDAIIAVQSGLPFTVGQQQGLLSTGTGNRPNRIASGNLVESHARSLVRPDGLSADHRQYRNLG